MMRIRLNSFGGMFPKVHPTRLQETASTQMQDMLLENGVLGVPSGTYQQNYLNGFASSTPIN
jgi:hypothetical protein